MAFVGKGLRSEDRIVLRCCCCCFCSIPPENDDYDDDGEQSVSPALSMHQNVHFARNAVAIALLIRASFATARERETDKHSCTLIPKVYSVSTYKECIPSFARMAGYI